MGVSIIKLREPEARVLVMRIAATFPKNEAETSQIKDAVPKWRKLGPVDLKPSTVRTGECMWQQIVGNVVSHEKTSVSLFKMGWAERMTPAKDGRKGIRLLAAGLAHLKKLGY